MRLLEPAFLVLAAPAILLWVGPLASRDRAHAALRTLAWLFVVVALARPVQTAEDTLPHRVVVLDRSTSVGPDALAEALTRLPGADEERALGSAHWTVVDIAGPDRAPLELDPRVHRIEIDGDGASPLGAALEAAVRVLSSGASTARIEVVTDGLATEDPHGAALVRALDAAALSGASVDVVTLPGVEGDLRVVGLEPRGAVRAGRETTVFARLVGAGQTVSLRLESPDGELASADGVTVDGDTSVPLTFTPEAPGFVDLTLTATLAEGAQDPVPGDLAYTATLAVDDPLEVLYLGSRVRGGAERLGELLGDGFRVRDAQSSGDVGTARAIVLDDRPAKDVPAALQRQIVDAVTDGRAGLLAAGGEAAFGPGGYHDEPIEELLPVEFVQKEEKRDPSTTLVVIIDTSGSMGGNRVQLAKEVSRLAIRRLLPHDKVGLVEFYGAKRWAVPIQPASNSIEIERALNRLDAGGGTVILPAIEEAYYGLKNVRTRYKHVLILTDGGVETGAFEPLLRRMADDGMNVSTVLIGSDAHSEFLVNIANWGQGRFYSVPNRFNLPEILLKQPASAKLPAYRPGLVNVRARGGSDWWGDVDPESTPEVAGYVETGARPGAETLLETADEGHPLLATWRYGLGRVTALTTELVGPGTEPWADWDGYGELLARTLERTAADDADPFAFDVLRVPGGALVIAETRPAFRGTAEVPAARAGDVDHAFDRVAPDRYELRLGLGSDEGLRVVLGTDARPNLRRLALDPVAGGARELQVAPNVARDLTARLAALEPRAPEARPHTRLRELASLFALLALVTYLADVAYRRWPRSAQRTEQS